MGTYLWTAPAMCETNNSLRALFDILDLVTLLKEGIEN